MKFGLRSPEGGCRKSLKRVDTNTNFYNVMKRFEVINGSKFERLSHAEMASIKGGRVCISCMKRSGKFKVGAEGTNWYLGFDKTSPYNNGEYDDMF